MKTSFLTELFHKKLLRLLYITKSFSSVSMKRSWVLNSLYVKQAARKKGLLREQVQKELYLRQVGETWQHKDFMKKLVL
jgi:hypothetical protein